MAKNKLSTPGYFIKRLKDAKIAVVRVFQDYALYDPRRWTILVDPGMMSIFITCFENKHNPKEILFELNDGGRLIPADYAIKTESIEVIVQKLFDLGVSTIKEDSKYYTNSIK